MTEGGAMSEERRIDPSTCSLCNTLALLSLVTMWTRIAEVTPQCSREITDVVDGYLKAVRSMDTFGCRLYTPSLTSYKNCPNSTLTCFAEEVKVLMFEFEDDQAFQDPGLYKDLPKRLMSVIDKNDTEQCLQCEVHDVKPAEDFLLGLKTVLEMMNSRCR